MLSQRNLYTNTIELDDEIALEKMTIERTCSHILFT